ncbi:FAD-dependent oxidoreductase [Kitasatospora gansuensis]
MPTVVIAGAGIAGLAGALALHGTGHRVLILERGDAPPEAPGQERPTVPQAVHSHTLTSLGLRVLRERAPRVLDALLDAGAQLLDLTAALPAAATDSGPEPGDQELVALGCRRSVLELVLYRAVRALPRVSIRHRSTVERLELDDHRRVRAVFTSTGERLAADLVVDATGRRAAHRAWLIEARIPAPDDRTAPSGLTGYTRFYRLLGEAPAGPPNRGNAAGGIWDHYAAVLHPADAGTFSVALATLPGDHELAGLRTEAGFTAAALASPELDRWLAPGVSAPISPVHAITVPPNSLRSVALSSPVDGLHPVGDAACLTNPLFGRGMSLALAHAFRLADLLAVSTDATLAAGRLTEELYLPWYEQSAAADQARIARWRAVRDGVVPPVPPAPSGTGVGLAEIAAGAATDGVVWRGLTRMLMTLATPAEVLGDEKFLARVRQVAPAVPSAQRAPTRAELVRLVGAAATGAGR